MEVDQNTFGLFDAEDWEDFLAEVDGFEPVTLGTLVAESPVVYFGSPYKGP